MFLTVSCRFVPPVRYGVNAGVAIATPARSVTPATSASHVACVDCLLLDNF